MIFFILLRVLISAESVNFFPPAFLERTPSASRSFCEFLRTFSNANFYSKHKSRKFPTSRFFLHFLHRNKLSCNTSYSAVLSILKNLYFLTLSFDHTTKFLRFEKATRHFCHDNEVNKLHRGGRKQIIVKPTRQSSLNFVSAAAPASNK